MPGNASTTNPSIQSMSTTVRHGAHDVVCARRFIRLGRLSQGPLHLALSLACGAALTPQWETLVLSATRESLGDLPHESFLLLSSF